MCGMYSSFQHEEIEITDLEGLKTFLNNFHVKISKTDDEIFKGMLFQDESNDWVFSFKEWDNIKLISYWYPETCLFLEFVAPYIEGRVYWDFETHDEAGWVEFKDKECIIHSGVMEWGGWRPVERFKGEEGFEVPEDLMKHHLANKLGGNKDVSRG